MRSNFRSRGGPGGLLALAIVLAAPALAHAQLLPNLPIRRERNSCAKEAQVHPQYRQIRQEYWGYYPTCWRKFPPGWGCPSPEAPNWEDAQVKQPLDLNRGAAPRPRADLPEMTDDPTKPDPMKPGGADLPPLPPDDGGLFNKDLKPGTPNPGGDPPAGDKPNPPAAGPGPGAAKPVDAPPGGLEGTPTAMAPRPRRGLLSGMFGNSRR